MSIDNDTHSLALDYSNFHANEFARILLSIVKLDLLQRKKHQTRSIKQS